MTDLAIYDMDKTVTRRPTYTPFLIHCAMRRNPLRLVFFPLVILSMLAYVAKLIDRGTLKEINHRLLLGHRRSQAELKPLVDSFAEKTIAHNIRPGARAAIARDKAEGRMVVMATASYRFYAQEIGARMGFDHVIGTNTILGLDEEVHAKIDGQNCYGPAKMAMILDWESQSEIVRGHVRFYSDHVTDRPVFEWSDEPVAVNPHGKLEELAKEQGWRIEDWG
ncbi:HAD family hydrolase [Sphingomicrobium nitratireducens]|uniref:HAD family hydrolase n=1 Tax=Sphingomicrobium nitratireducens TaxID=2964666 RepID=UPI0022408A7A|nr:HAD-IB family hydrolase [Sphingomicrobium nitratireducens]